MNGEFDVLKTTIIESGLMFPMLIRYSSTTQTTLGCQTCTDARSGRRSNKKAFCYFITPPYDMMTDEAEYRQSRVFQSG
jgi:transcription-repair coupling factor (superfamily II helicase)